LQLIRN